MVLLIGFIVFGVLLRMEIKEQEKIESYDFKVGNILIKLNGYKTNPESVSKLVEKTKEMYKLSNYDVDKHLEKTIFMNFIPGVIKISGQPERNLAGRANYDNADVAFFRKNEKGEYVAWDEMPVEKTAFCHELEHIIIARESGSINNGLHHNIMEEVKRFYEHSRSKL